MTTSNYQIKPKSKPTLIELNTKVSCRQNPKKLKLVQFSFVYNTTG